MKWWRQWRLRRTREKYAKWKAICAELDRLGEMWPATIVVRSEKRQEAAGKMAIYEERIETLMRE